MLPGLNRTFHIRTYGCQMNARDSEALGCLLEQRGFRHVEREEEADAILLNTCSVRDHAEKRVFGKTGNLRKLKDRNPDMVIGVLGCMAQNHGDAIIEKLPHVDLVVGTDQIHLLPTLLEQAFDGQRGVVCTEPDRGVLGNLNPHVPGAVSAFISVMRGCDQYCSYCIVPYVRGHEKSRSIEDIVAEVEQVIAGGTKEIFLLGQNITAYGLAEARKAGQHTHEISPFADLLAAVHDVPGVRRIRFTSPHPKYMNDACLDAMCGLPKVCKAFHIPLQSGSDRVLKRMHRGYTAAEYLERIRRIREATTEAAFSTDVIVGFPGETDGDFEATRAVMDEAGFGMAYIFKYSPRAGTLAARKLPDDVPVAVKEERNQVLLQDLERCVAKANDAYRGRTLEVLVTGESKRNRERWSGRTDTNKVCIFEPQPGVAPGDLVRIRVTRTTSHSLFGELVSGRCCDGKRSD